MNDGSENWVKEYGADGIEERATAIVCDLNGTIFVTGVYRPRYNIFTGDSENNLSSLESAFVLKISSSSTPSIEPSQGSLERFSPTNPEGKIIGRDLVLDFSESDTIPNLLLVGELSGTSNFNVYDFNPNASDLSVDTEGIRKVFVLKYSPYMIDMEGTWVRSFGGNTDAIPNIHISADELGNVYTAGCDGLGSADYDPDPVEEVNLNIRSYLHKMDSSGNFEWIHGTINGDIKDFRFMDDGNILITGDLNNGTNLNHMGTGSSFYYTLPAYGSIDAYIKKLTPEGEFISARTFGSGEIDRAQGCIPTEDGFYLYGRYGTGTDFDFSGNESLLTVPENISIGSYLAKYSLCNNVITTTDLFSCTDTLYNGINLNSTGEYFTINRLNLACDVVETINFTEGTPSSSSQVISGCSPFEYNGEIFETSGEYTQIIENNSGCDSTITLSLTLVDSPVVELELTSSLVACAEDLITAEAIGASTYSWNVNNSDEANNSFQLDSETIPYDYTVIVTGTNSSGATSCSNLDSVVVTILPLPVVELTGDINICEGESTTFTVSGATSYEWSTLSTETSEEFSPTESSTYTVTGTSDACSTAETFEITVQSNPQIILTPDTTLCMGQSLTLAVSGADDYLWMNDLGENDEVSVSPVETTTYFVTGTTEECSSTAETTITYIDSQAPTLTITPDTSICPNTTIELTASGAESYEWSEGLGSGDTHSVSPNESTTYSLIAQDNGCYNEGMVTITLFSVDTPDITQDGSILSTELTESYQWYLEGILIENEVNQTIEPTQDGNYTVETTDQNGCISTSDDYLFTIISVDELESNIAIFPNPFSEELILEFNNSQNDKIEIFNSLGQRIFFTDVINDSRLKIATQNWASRIYHVKIGQMYYRVIRN